MKKLLTLSGIFGLAAAFVLGGEARGATLTVCPSGCQYSIIQAAIDSAQNGDVISIQAGHYFENINTGGKQLTLNGVSSRQAILDGGLKGTVVTVPEGNSVAISGLTIMDGIGPASGGGGGITSYAPLTVSHSTIINNISQQGGGGIFESAGCCEIGAMITISYCTIANNDAASGGAGVALAMESGTAEIVDSTIARNGHSGASGGGLWIIDGVVVTIKGSSIIDNAGGGIFATTFVGSSTLTIENSSIAGNTSSANGGGIVANGYSLVLNHVGLTRNVGANGGGISMSAFNGHRLTGATTSLSDTYLVGNTATVDGGGTSIDAPVTATGVVNLSNSPDNCATGSTCP